MITEKNKMNPYSSKKDQKEEVLKIENIKKLCLAKGGVMFKLFDLGKLGLDNQDKIMVFKNVVGDVIRKFIRSIENGHSNNVAQQTAILEDELSKLGKLAFGDVEKYTIYKDKVEQILVVLKEQ